MAPQHSIHCLSIIIFKNYVLLKYVLSEFVFFFNILPVYKENNWSLSSLLKLFPFLNTGPTKETQNSLPGFQGCPLCLPAPLESQTLSFTSRPDF